MIFCSERERERRLSRNISLLNGKILWKDTNRSVCTPTRKLEREKCKRQAQQAVRHSSASDVHTRVRRRSFRLLHATVKKKGRARHMHPLPRRRALESSAALGSLASELLQQLNITSRRHGTRNWTSSFPLRTYIHVALMSSVIPRHNSCTLARTRNSTPRAQQTYEQLMFAQSRELRMRAPLLSSLISSHLGRAERWEAGVVCAGPRCLCSILRKLCRNSALVLYLLRRALSLPLPLPVPAPLHLVSFYGAIKLRSRVTTHQTTILCPADVFMAAIARHRPNGRTMNPPPK